MTDGLDPLSGVPRYIQIARVVEAEIRAGTWTVGNVAPSMITLTQRFQVAKETARHAQRRLIELGFVVSVPGIGMVVTPEAYWPEQH